MTDCVTCAAPARTGVQFCRGCEAKLTAYLADIPDLLEQLLVTVCRQDKFQVGREGGPGPEKPMPFNEKASLMLSELERLVIRWARAFGMTGRACGFDGSGTAAGYLTDHIPYIVTNITALELYREIESAVSKSRRMIDRPADRIFAGPCNTEVTFFGGIAYCRNDLYANPGASKVVCGECHTQHDVQERREWMLSEISERYVDAGLAASLLTQLGIQISSATVRRYGREGLLTVVLQGAKQTATYQLGQVIEVFFDKKEHVGGRPMKKVS